MKPTPDHDWTDGFSVSDPIRPAGNLSGVLGPELRNTFASVASERLPELGLFILLASKQPVRSRGKECRRRLRVGRTVDGKADLG